MQLRVAEQYIIRFGEIAKETNTVVIPANLADVGSIIGTALTMIGKKPGAV